MNYASQWWTHPDDPNVKLWRYMDLSKFVALLQSKSIAFARADLLGDRFEGSVGALNAVEAEDIIRLRDSLPEDSFWRTRSDDQIRHQFSQMSASRRQLIPTMFISCWHMNEHESAAMWKLYSRSADAICIQTRFKLISDQFPDWIFSTAVKYEDFDQLYIPTDNGFSPFSYKRASFAHEREIRFLAWAWADPSNQGSRNFVPPDEQPPILEFAVDLPSIIENIRVSPDAPEWFTRVVQGLVDDYGLAIKVGNSRLNKEPLY